MDVRKVLAAAVLTVGVTMTTASCGGFEGKRTTDTVDARDEATQLGDNPFIPEDANIGDCVSSNPRPNCGSDARGGWQQLLTFAVLMLGMAFIGWRIFRSVRHRDLEPDQPVPAPD